MPNIHNDRMAGRDDHPRAHDRYHRRIWEGYPNAIQSFILLFPGGGEHSAQRTRSSSTPLGEGRLLCAHPHNYSQIRAQGFNPGHPAVRVYAVYTSPCTRICWCTQGVYRVVYTGVYTTRHGRVAYTRVYTPQGGIPPYVHQGIHHLGTRRKMRNVKNRPFPMKPGGPWA